MRYETARSQNSELWCSVVCRAEPVLVSGGKHQTDISKINSSSTGVPSGRLATPYTRRLGFLSLPKTFWSSSEAPSATFGCSRTSPEVATDTPSRTIRSVDGGHAAQSATFGAFLPQLWSWSLFGRAV